MLDLRETKGVGNLLRSFYTQHKHTQIVCSLLEDRSILHSGDNRLRILKEEIARIFLLKYRNPQLEQGSMHSTRRSGAAWLGGKAEQYHTRAAWKPQERDKGAEIAALRKCFIQNPHQAKRQETVRRSTEMVGIKRGQSRANLWEY